MSDNFLCLIPTDPLFVPDLELQREAKRLLTTYVPDADEVNTRVTETVEFVNPMENLQRALCPHCGADLLPGEWWGDAMDAAYAENCLDLTAYPPCCGKEVSLNALQYDMPAGFARFVLEAMNPNLKSLADASLAALEQLLATPLRVVWVRI